MNKTTTANEKAANARRKMAALIMARTGAKLEPDAMLVGGRVVVWGAPEECLLVSAYFVDVLKVDGVTIEDVFPEDAAGTRVTIPLAGLEAAMVKHAA